MAMELKDVNSLVELRHALLFGLKLVDVELATLEHQVLRLVLGRLCSFQCLEGDKAEANQ